MQEFFDHEIEYLLQIVQRDIKEYADFMLNNDGKEGVEFMKEVESKLQNYLIEMKVGKINNN